MHERLRELLGRDVVGLVQRSGDAFYDIGLGRICLPALDLDAIEAIAYTVAAEFPVDVEARDHLHFDDRQQLRRGMVEIKLRDPGMGGTYLLQITHRAVLSLYERRFELDDGVYADLSGTVADGIGAILGSGIEAPLKILSGYDELKQRYLDHLDTVVRAARGGEAVDTAPMLLELRDAVRRAWGLIPWPLRQGRSPVARPPSDRLCKHDRTFERTVMLATEVRTGEHVYEYVHTHNPLERYRDVCKWLAGVHQNVEVSHEGPQYAIAIGRAPSLDAFVQHFPGFAGIVAADEEDATDTDSGPEVRH